MSPFGCVPLRLCPVCSRARHLEEFSLVGFGSRHYRDPWHIADAKDIYLHPISERGLLVLLVSVIHLNTLASDVPTYHSRILGWRVPVRLVVIEEPLGFDDGISVWLALPFFLEMDDQIWAVAC